MSGVSRVPSIPATYRRTREPNAYIAREKARIVRQLNFGRWSVYFQRHLGLYLLALERTAEAIQVLRYAHRNVVFRGNYDVWYNAASACSIESYLARTRGRVTSDAAPCPQRFVEEPASALISQPSVYTAPGVRRYLAAERERYSTKFDDLDPDVAVEALAGWAETLIYVRELSWLGFPAKGKLDVKSIDSEIKKTLALLGASLKRLGAQDTFRKPRYTYSLVRKVEDGHFRDQHVAKLVGWREVRMREDVPRMP